MSFIDLNSLSTPDFDFVYQSLGGERAHIQDLHCVPPLAAWGTLHKKGREDCRSQRD